MSEQTPPRTTTDAGIPAASDEHSLTVGPNGPVLLQDLLASVTPQVLAYWRSADMTALGEAVSWADPGPGLLQQRHFHDPGRNPVWHRWRVATRSVAMARAYLWAGNACILVPRGIR